MLEKKKAIMAHQVPPLVHAHWCMLHAKVLCACTGRCMTDAARTHIPHVYYSVGDATAAGTCCIHTQKNKHPHTWLFRLQTEIYSSTVSRCRNRNMTICHLLLLLHLTKASHLSTGLDGSVPIHSTVVANEKLTVPRPQSRGRRRR